MQSAVVAEAVRSGFVESRHRGTLVATAADGAEAWAVGDPRLVCYPRSAAKPLQAVALLRHGARLAGPELAIAAGSHCGRPEHLAAVRRILGSAGLVEEDLRTPAALPWPPEPYLSAGGEPLAALMNCSGQHAAMLALCVDRGWSTADYLNARHPLQRLITGTLEELLGEQAVRIGIDGCGAPVPAFSLLGLARAFGRLVLAGPDTPEGRVAAAMRAHPEFVDGPDGRDTVLMRAVPGLLAKAGAEGVQCVALPDGRAIAITIEDGARRAVGPVLAEALRREGVTSSKITAVCDSAVFGGGARVGSVRPVLPVSTGARRAAARPCVQRNPSDTAVKEGTSVYESNTSSVAQESAQEPELTLVRRAVSKDGSAKTVWRLHDGNQVESLSFELAKESFSGVEPTDGQAVPVETPRGHTVCISSQAGCNVGCRFCATGLQPMRRNLTAEEVVEQVRQTRLVENRTAPSRVIFAGMGEPLLNADEVLRAVKLFEQEPGVAHVSISTIGVVPALERLTRETSSVDLFVSLHATEDETRTKLIPLNKAYPIADVLRAAAEFATVQGRMVDISYLLFAGVNDTDADADRLIRLLDPALFRVQLLLWNDVPGLPFSRINDEVAELFCARLVEGGVSTYITPSKARDIDAGCGQMITEQAKEHRIERSQNLLLPVV